MSEGLGSCVTTFGIELLILLIICSLLVLCIFVKKFYHFGFEGETFVVIASVTGHCLPFFFSYFR